MAVGVGYWRCSPELYQKYYAANKLVDTDFYLVTDTEKNIQELYLGKILLSSEEESFTKINEKIEEVWSAIQELPIEELDKELNNKFDKAGGDITGNVSINGDLNVNGTISTVNQNTLAVKDNILVTNADGSLTPYTGIVSITGKIIEVVKPGTYNLYSASGIVDNERLDLNDMIDINLGYAAFLNHNKDGQVPISRIYVEYTEERSDVEHGGWYRTSIMEIYTTNKTYTFTDSDRPPSVTLTKFFNVDQGPYRGALNNFFSDLIIEEKEAAYATNLYNSETGEIQLGLGYIERNEENGIEFTFIGNENQSVATRASNIEHGNLVKWDANANTLVDSHTSIWEIEDEFHEKIQAEAIDRSTTDAEIMNAITPLTNEEIDEIWSTVPEGGFTPFTMTTGFVPVWNGETFEDGIELDKIGSDIEIDQEYKQTSANPQSGTAVAEALKILSDQLAEKQMNFRYFSVPAGKYYPLKRNGTYMIYNSKDDNGIEQKISMYRLSKDEWTSVFTDAHQISLTTAVVAIEGRYTYQLCGMYTSGSSILGVPSTEGFRQATTNYAYVTSPGTMYVCECVQGKPLSIKDTADECIGEKGEAYKE